MFQEKVTKEFRLAFKNEESCLRYLCELKWGSGFTCVKCQHRKFTKGRKWYYRRCANCKYDESVTANTIFHKCKIGLLKAFEMAFRIGGNAQGVSSCELSRKVGCNQKSAWLFKAKLQETMLYAPLPESHEKTQTDLFTIEVQNTQEDTPAITKRVHIAIEKKTDQRGREQIIQAYCLPNDRLAMPAEHWECVLEQVGTRSKQKKKDPKKVRRIYSQSGNSGLIQKHLSNIRNWLRDVHHHCSEHRILHYLDEFHFRFNRRSIPVRSFYSLLKIGMHYTPKPYLTIKCELTV